MGLKYVFETHLDDPRTTIKHRDIILTKKFLKKIYLGWYQNFIDETKKNPTGKYLEIGSGGGFLKDLIPNIITSDILKLPHVEMAFSAEGLPFKDGELDGIFMVNVLHHIPRPYMFLREAERCLKKGGKIIMIEPAYTHFSKFIYQTFHHEPFLPKGDWETISSGPLSGSNQAIPYIYLVRDKERFAKEFPSLQIESIKLHTAFVHILSGGVSRKCFVPEWSFGFWKGLEKVPGVLNLFSMFATYVVSKK